MELNHNLEKFMWMREDREDRISKLMNVLVKGYEEKI